MKYIHLYQTVEEFDTDYWGEKYLEPWVSLTVEDEKVDYNKKPIPPLTFKIISGGTVGWFDTSEDHSARRTIEYKINDNDWVEITSSWATKISVNDGDIIQFRGDNDSYTSWDEISEDYCSSCFVNSTATFEVEGNVMSLIKSSGYETLIELQSAYTFKGLFKRCTGLTSAENLILPATTLTYSCYQEMFSGCTNLTTAPKLPATTLANYCYQNMFAGCTSLTQAPELPATTLAQSCYLWMFRDCTNLTQAPELPATTLVSECYLYMFTGCTSLTKVPELPATTLANRCYDNMFRGCTSLNYVKCLATDISANNCTSDWLYGVSPTGTFVKDANMASWRTGRSGIPNGWTVQDA